MKISVARYGSARQSAKWTAGALRIFGAFLELWQLSVSKPFSSQPPVTPTVGQPHMQTIHILY
jgi:hypothetical protein